MISVFKKRSEFFFVIFQVRKTKYKPLVIKVRSRQELLFFLSSLNKLETGKEEEEEKVNSELEVGTTFTYKWCVFFWGGGAQWGKILSKSDSFSNCFRLPDLMKRIFFPILIVMMVVVHKWSTTIFITGGGGAGPWVLKPQYQDL